MASGKVARRTVVSDVAATTRLPRNRGADRPSLTRLLAIRVAARATALATLDRRVPRQIPVRPADMDAGSGADRGASRPARRARRRSERVGLLPVRDASCERTAELMDACLDACAAALREQHPDFGRDVAIDASDLPALANGQRYVSQRRPGARAVQRPGRIVGAPLGRLHAQGRRLLRLQDRPRCLHQDGAAARVANRAPRATMSRCSSLPCSTRSALAASSPRRSPMDKGYDSDRASTTSARHAAATRSSR